MPKKPTRQCPTCKTKITGKTCPKCDKRKKREAKEYDDKRGTATERGYNHAWSKIRDMKLNEDPLCERCMKVGIDEPATRVHHKDRDSSNNREENLESLCKPCHEAEHKGERWGR